MEGPGAIAGARRPGSVRNPRPRDACLCKPCTAEQDAESSAGLCSEEARQAEAQRTERQRRMQLQHEEQLAKERAMAPEANPLCAPTPALAFIFIFAVTCTRVSVNV